jgi:V/A-type H+/Na+-transporting ATPase subunit E
MEELRSTEILDREIQDDARRKAEKILKANEAECERILSGVASRVDSARSEKEAEYAARLAAYVRDSEAAIPLEKQRKLVSFIDDSVKAALDGWFAGIGKERRLELYANLLRKAKPLFTSSGVDVFFRGYGEGDVRALVDSIFGPALVKSVAESASASFGDGIVLESADGLIRCRATMDEIRETLLAGKRQELAEALLGGRIPEWEN